MVRQRLITAFAVVILGFMGRAAAQQEALISITPGEVTDLNRVESLQLPVYAEIGGTILVAATEAQRSALQGFRIPFTTVDPDLAAADYYLLGGRTRATLPHSVNGATVLATDGSTALLRASTARVPDVDRVQFTLLKVLPSGKVFRNERYYAPRAMPLSADSTIHSIVAEVNPDSIRSTIAHLQNFGTRYTFAPTRNAVVSWIQNRFQEMGYTDVVRDPFPVEGITDENVIATLPGTTNPEGHVIIGGHHDAISSSPMTAAPGADDNASGTAAALEIARVFKKKSPTPGATIKFATFGAEEQGLVGSWAYAGRLKAEGRTVSLMINHDMIATNFSPIPSSVVNVNYYTGFEFMADLAVQAVRDYSRITAARGGRNSTGSDSYPFYAQGYPAVFFFERDFSPVYHSPADTIGNCNIEYCAEVVKGSCALALVWANAPSQVRNFALADPGTGSTLYARWSGNKDTDLMGYRVYVGRSTGIYDTAFTTSDTAITINTLTEGVRYYVGLTAYDGEGYESFITERNERPLSAPRTPANFADTPQRDAILLSWSPNSELDLAGYNLYRGVGPTGLGTKITQTPVQDSVFTDGSAAEGVFYWYSLTAVDAGGSESAPTPSIRSRVASLNQGILVVDETKGGSGSLMNPTDAQVNEFFEQLLTGFTTVSINADSLRAVKMADLGAYSTVVWHGNDLSDRAPATASAAALEAYLRAGGKLFLTTYRPSTALTGNTALGKDYGPGDYLYDVLKIARSELNVLSRCIGATPLAAGYPPLRTDTSKTQSQYKYHLSQIEVIFPAPGAAAVYAFETEYDTAQVQGAQQGKPVGIQYTGDDYRLFVTSIPLYYMEEASAQALAMHVLTTSFAEPLSVEEQSAQIPTRLVLHQNHPNPFNPRTVIRFEIPEAGHATVKVFDILGREVATLVNEELVAGLYERVFDARALSSGTYVYRLSAAGSTVTRKMMLIR